MVASAVAAQRPLARSVHSHLRIECSLKIAASYPRCAAKADQDISNLRHYLLNWRADMSIGFLKRFAISASAGVLQIRRE